MVLMLTSRRPPSFHWAYNINVLVLGWNPPCMVRSFLVLISVAAVSSFGRIMIPEGYLITGNAYILMTWIWFLTFSWLFRICLTLQRYLIVVDFHAGYHDFARRIKSGYYKQIKFVEDMSTWASLSHLAQPFTPGFSYILFCIYSCASI